MADSIEDLIYSPIKKEIEKNISKDPWWQNYATRDCSYDCNLMECKCYWDQRDSSIFGG